MAAPMQQCICHIVEGVNEPLITCSDTSWAKICECVDIWRHLDGAEKGIAQNFDLCCRDGAVFHRTCYQRFTAKNRIEQGQKRREKGRLRQPDVDHVDCLNVSPHKKRKFILRSQFISCTNSDDKFQERRSMHVLPEQCIICRSTKTVIERSTHKRKIERLVTCETNADKLLTAATLKGDDRLLVQIGQRDPVSIEVRYHASCYKSYTKCIYSASSDCLSRPLSQSFEIFCKEIIENKIIAKKEVIRMNSLTKTFINNVKDTEEIDIASYRNFQLKARLIQKYSDQLVFLQPESNLCELVFFRGDNSEAVVNLDSVSSDSDTCDSDFEHVQNAQLPQYESNQEQFAQLYRSATIIRAAIKSTAGLATWPPTAEYLSTERCADMIPNMIFNFLAWCCSFSEEFSTERVTVSGIDSKKRIISIAQDVIHLASQGRKLMPKHIALGMTIRHLTGSAKLQQLLNSFGHCVSHSLTLEHDTALATRQLQQESNIPQGFHQNIFTTLVWDNNDFGEETLSDYRRSTLEGKGTTHNTNGIIIQREQSTDTPEPPDLVSVTRTKKRTLDAPPVEINQFFAKKRSGPNQFQGQESRLERLPLVQEEPRRVDLALTLAKFSQGTELLPGWTGCHQQLSCDTKPLNKIGYLPVIDASTTDKSTVNTILEKSLETAKNLNLSAVVLVMDQAIYAKAQEIRWQGRREIQDSLILRLGEFHTAMAFLGVLGKRFDCAGLRDVAIESGIVAEGSIKGVISGHHYNRSLRCHKIISEALHRLQIEEYLNQLPPEESDQALSVMKSLHSSFPAQFASCLKYERVGHLLKDYQVYVEQKCSQNEMYAFWTSYMKMVELLLLFITATREGNWELHLSAVRDMIPWFFAYGRINYSRYLPVYYMEMKALPSTHPDIHSHLVDGEFAVKRHDSHGFALTACDQVIEQTYNRDSKTKGGMTGITLNKGAVRRWILSHPDRAAIAGACFDMSTSKEIAAVNSDIKPARIQVEEQAVQDVMLTVSEFTNPFTCEKENEIFNICSGKIASESLKVSFSSAYDKGEDCFQQFVQERLIDGTKDVFDKLSLPTGITFSDVEKKEKPKSSLAVLKEKRDLLARLLVIAKEKGLDLKDVLQYPLSSLQPALSNYDGTLAKTNKSALLHELEKICQVKTRDIVQNFETVVIVDAMALIQQQRQFPDTFGNFATDMLNQLVKTAKKNNAKRIDFVADRYLSSSIKDCERMLRNKQGETKVRITRIDQKMPLQMKKFLACGENKEALLHFVVDQWKNCSPTLLSNVQIYATHGQTCLKIYQDIDGETVSEEVPELYSDQEEADTRMFLHAVHASKLCPAETEIIIRTVDTDVVVLALWVATLIKQPLRVHFTVGNNARALDVTLMSKQLGNKHCEALVGLHPFTGCDTVSAFKGKGKVKALKLMMKTPSYCKIFCDMGKEWSVSNVLEKALEKFVCDLYGWSECDSINRVRYNCFRFGMISDLSLPPNMDSLILHTKRANYQAKTYRSCLQQVISAPSPKGNGWDITSDHKLTIKWNHLPIAPAAVLQSVNCSCKKTSCTCSKCSCRKAGIVCTDLCKCGTLCQNRKMTDNDSDIDSE